MKCVTTVYLIRCKDVTSKILNMETSRNNICSVCLNIDRKISVLNDPEKKQYFLQFIWEISACLGDIMVSLCWECEALLRRFTRFKKQAQKSVLSLQNYTEKNLQHAEVKPSLQINKQFNISLQPSINDTVTTHSEVIKLETNEMCNIKEEFDIDILTENQVYSDNYSDDDNKTLIEISSEKKKNNNYKKKRQKKEKDTADSQIKTEEIEIKNVADTRYYREKELTDQEIIEERRCMELREDYVNAVFKCEKCIISFPNADDLKDHISIKHEWNSSLWKCSWCSCSFGSLVASNYHTSKHTRRYVCVACAHQATSKRGAVRHYQITHMVRPDMDYDDVQEKSSENGTILETNGTDSTKTVETPSFHCDFCEKSFKWKTSLRKHVETHRIESGQKRRPYCEPCRLSFTTTSNLQKHVKTSSKHQIQLKLRKLKEESQQPDASAVEKQQAKIEQIRSSVNSGRQLFPCAQCDRKFQWRGNLLRHLHSHAAKANGELVCAPCNRTFSSIATYKQHMKISRKHVSEDDFKYMCSDCGKRFANKTRLKDHIDWEHLKNYVHKCPVCQKVFKSHTSLYLHKQVVHKKDNAEHLCDHCGKPFPNRAKLRSHIVALHTSESPYACSTCNARFSWHSCLSRHVRRVHKVKLDKL